MAFARLCASALLALAHGDKAAPTIASTASRALAASNLAPWEKDLAPYVDDLVNYEETPQGRRAITLAHLTDVVPSFLVDQLMKIFLPDGVLTVPVNKEIQISPWIKALIGPLNIALPDKFTIVDLTLSGLDTLKDLAPLEFEANSLYSWRSFFEMGRLGASLRLRMELLGQMADVHVDLDLEDPKLDVLLVAAFDRTKMCETWGALLRSSLSCAVWPMFVNASAGVAGFRFETFGASVSSFTADIGISGLVGEVDEQAQALATQLTKSLNEKAAELVKLVASTSDHLKEWFNERFLDGVAKMHAERPCPVDQWAKVDYVVSASRVCIKNHGAFFLSAAERSCTRHSQAKASVPFPAGGEPNCWDVQDRFPHAAEGETMRVTTDAVAGLNEIVDPAIRFASGSNVATWDCSGVTFAYGCKLVSVLPVNSSASLEASEVCVHNKGGFSMRFWLGSQSASAQSDSTDYYPLLQKRCVSIKDVQDVQAGQRLFAEVKTLWGKQLRTDRAVTYKDTGSSVTFVCRGTIWNPKCELETVLPQKAVAKAPGSV